MRSTTPRKFVAAAYGLGLIWTAAIVGGAVVLTPPLLELYEVLGIESSALHVALTLSVDIVLATSVAAAFGVVAGVVARRWPSMHRPKIVPGAAAHRA